MENFSVLSESEKQYYMKHHKYLKISDDATFDEEGELIAEDLSKDNIIKGDNYLKFAVTPDGKITRWNKKTIKYSVVDGTRFYKNFIDKATNTYNDLFKDYFKFEYTKDVNNSDIAIVVKPQFESNEKSKESFLLGLTTSSIDEKTNNINSAKITLVYKSPNNPKASITGDEMYKVVLHELGHAVGISGHSDNEDDIMYPSLTKHALLSQRDRVTIKMLYSNNEKVLKKQLKHSKRAKLSEAKIYAKNAGTSNETLALINLAQTYFENGQKEKALETYKKAIQKDERNPEIYKSMAECYYFSKKYDSALKFFEKSYSLITDGEKRTELENMIGVTYAKIDDYESAYKYFVKSYMSNSENLEVLQNLVAACMKTNRKQEVLNYIDLYVKSGHSIEKDTFLLKARAWAKS